MELGLAGWRADIGKSHPSLCACLHFLNPVILKVNRLQPSVCFDAIFFVSTIWMNLFQFFAGSLFFFPSYFLTSVFQDKCSSVCRQSHHNWAERFGAEGVCFLSPCLWDVSGALFMFECMWNWFTGCNDVLSQAKWVRWTKEEPAVFI